METIEKVMVDWLNAITEPGGLLQEVLLALWGVGSPLRSRGVQFRMLGEMIRLVFQSTGKPGEGRHISSFQAFNVSLATRIGTGNLAGVATAIAIGGTGAIFW